MPLSQKLLSALRSSENVIIESQQLSEADIESFAKAIAQNKKLKNLCLLNNTFYPSFFLELSQFLIIHPRLTTLKLHSNVYTSQTTEVRDSTQTDHIFEQLFLQKLIETKAKIFENQETIERTFNQIKEKMIDIEIACNLITILHVIKDIRLELEVLRKEIQILISQTAARKKVKPISKKSILTEKPSLEALDTKIEEEDKFTTNKTNKIVEASLNNINIKLDDCENLLNKIKDKSTNHLQHQINNLLTFVNKNGGAQLTIKDIADLLEKNNYLAAQELVTKFILYINTLHDTTISGNDLLTLYHRLLSDLTSFQNAKKIIETCKNPTFFIEEDFPNIAQEKNIDTKKVTNLLDLLPVDMTRVNDVKQFKQQLLTNYLPIIFEEIQELELTKPENSLIENNDDLNSLMDILKKIKSIKNFKLTATNLPEDKLINIALFLLCEENFPHLENINLGNNVYLGDNFLTSVTEAIKTHKTLKTFLLTNNQATATTIKAFLNELSTSNFNLTFVNVLSISTKENDDLVKLQKTINSRNEAFEEKLADMSIVYNNGKKVLTDLLDEVQELLKLLEKYSDANLSESKSEVQLVITNINLELKKTIDDTDLKRKSEYTWIHALMYAKEIKTIIQKLPKIQNSSEIFLKANLILKKVNTAYLTELLTKKPASFMNQLSQMRKALQLIEEICDLFTVNNTDKMFSLFAIKEFFIAAVYYHQYNNMDVEIREYNDQKNFFKKGDLIYKKIKPDINEILNIQTFTDLFNYSLKLKKSTSKVTIASALDTFSGLFKKTTAKVSDPVSDFVDQSIKLCEFFFLLYKSVEVNESDSFLAENVHLPKIRFDETVMALKSEYDLPNGFLLEKDSTESKLSLSELDHQHQTDRHYYSKEFRAHKVKAPRFDELFDEKLTEDSSDKNVTYKS